VRWYAGGQDGRPGYPQWRSAETWMPSICRAVPARPAGSSRLSALVRCPDDAAPSLGRENQAEMLPHALEQNHRSFWSHEGEYRVRRSDGRAGWRARARARRSRSKGSYATVGRNAKIDWKALSQRIGHADVAFTMKQYVQTDLEADRRAATTLAELIIGGSLVSMEIGTTEGAA